MKPIFILLALVSTMLTGCISQRYARLRERPDHSELLLGKTYVCILPFLGAPLIVDRCLQLPGHKTEYRGEEVLQTSKGCMTNPYVGSVVILPDKKRVVVRLTNEGRPFPFNGKWSYK